MIATSATINGTLFVVATPIGNRSDITLRALEILKSVAMILAEDTRHTLQLLNSYGIKNSIRSLHEHNEKEKADEILNKLESGESFALVSDAGTPLISDPGYSLVSQARKRGIDVVPIPGACAFVAALQVAGVPCESFSFFGFLPAKSKARCAKLQELLPIAHTLVFYESTHRICDCIVDIGQVFGENTPLVLLKELTKTYEKFLHAPVPEVLNWLQADSQHTKGEFVLIIPPRALAREDDVDLTILRELLQELPLKQAVKIAAKLMDIPKNELYKIALDYVAMDSADKPRNVG